MCGNRKEVFAHANARKKKKRIVKDYGCSQPLFTWEGDDDDDGGGGGGGGGDDEDEARSE